jgi:hypothetical protein
MTTTQENLFRVTGIHWKMQYEIASVKIEDLVLDCDIEFTGGFQGSYFKFLSDPPTTFWLRYLESL